MALWEFSAPNKHGMMRTRIVHTEGSLNTSPKFGSPQIVRRFKYKYTHPIYPPMIWKHEGKTYLMPKWKEVMEGTTLNDVEWVKPKPKVVVKQEPIVITSASSSSDKTYTTTYYPDSGKFWCDCPGMWRSGGNCKHVKQMRKENE
jgi:hypothetical protein